MSKSEKKLGLKFEKLAVQGGPIEQALPQPGGAHMPASSSSSFPQFSESSLCEINGEKLVVFSNVPNFGKILELLKAPKGGSKTKNSNPEVLGASGGSGGNPDDASGNDSSTPEGD